MSSTVRISLTNTLIQTLQQLGGRSSRSEIYDLIAEKLGISKEARFAENKDGSYKFEMELNERRASLLASKILDDSLPGLWALTMKGQAALPFSEAELIERGEVFYCKVSEKAEEKSVDEDKPEVPETTPKVVKKTWSRKKKVTSKKVVKKTGTKRKYIRKNPFKK